MRRLGLAGMVIFGLASAVNAQAQAVQISGLDPMVYHATVLNVVDQANCAPLPASESCLIVGMGGYSRVSVQIMGTGSYAVNFEQTVNGQDWVPATLTPSIGAASVTQASVTGLYTGIVGGALFRVRVTSLPAGQAVTVAARVTAQ